MSDALLLTLAATAAALLAVLVTVTLTRIGRSWVARGRVRQGQHAEAQAERLLERHGYRILERQVTGSWRLFVDDAPVDVTCRADLIVRRKRRRYVAEVKSGELGARPTAPATRRQLLEYTHAFDVDGVLLVDMVAGRVREVRFRKNS